jgi:hypothetical protein
MANAIIKKAVEILKSEGIDAFDNDYIAVDEDFNSIFLNTKMRHHAAGDEAGEKLLKALAISVPLSRAIGATSADMGMQHWHERGLEFSWSYHPDRGSRISILASKA